MADVVSFHRSYVHFSCTRRRLQIECRNMNWCCVQNIIALRIEASTEHTQCRRCGFSPQAHEAFNECV